MKLTARMMLCILGIVIMGMTASSVFIYRQTQSILIEATRDTQISLAQGTAKKLETLVTGLKTYMHLQSEGARILNSLILKPDASVEQREKIIKLALQQISALKERSGNAFVAVAILDTKGDVVTATDPALKGSNYKGQSYFQSALHSKDPVVSRPVISSLTGTPVFFILDPIVDKSTGKAVGVLLGSVNIMTISQDSVDGIKVASSGYGYALDQQGLVMMHPQKDLILKSDVSQEAWFKDMLTRKNGYISYTWQGNARYAAFATIPATDWLVVVTADHSDLMTPVENIRNTSIVATIVVLLVIAVALFIIVRGIVGALRNTVSFAEEVADGNLDKELTIKRADELGTLAAALQNMVFKLKETLALAHNKTAEAEAATGRAAQAVEEATEARKKAETSRREGAMAAACRIEGVVSAVSTLSHFLSENIAKTSAGASDAGRMLGDTASAMEEMNSTVLEVARNASTASQASAHMRIRAEEGSSIVSQVVNDFGKMQSQSEELKQDMELLTAQAAAINNVMGVISDIADQTNLLALNAAIEAARAGDTGRGFAVVADEVRKLAEKTMGSTTEVGKAIKEIQQSARKNMENVDRTTQMISTTTLLAEKSGQTLQEIVGLVDKSSDQVHTIATSAEEQSATSEEITRTLTMVNEHAASNVEIMSSVSDAISDLLRQAKELEDLVNELKHQ